METFMVEIPNNPFENFTCPIPLPTNKTVSIGHGSGGSLSKSLITSIFYKHFSNEILKKGNDFADLFRDQLNPGLEIITSTDAHVVSPLFFPGGDIGRLAVAGTVNDVSMSGAVPKYLTASFIIEEGFSMDELERIAKSMRICADDANVQIVAGDTKVVEKGKADKVFISTTGIGVRKHNLNISGENAKPGDSVFISGSIGDHGIAVLAARNELGFTTEIQSDVAPLNGLIQSLLAASDKVHVLRDPTRGGVGTTLNEIASQSNVRIILDETTLPIRAEVQGACDLLGFDPLYVANEGKVIAVAAEQDAQKILATMENHPLGKGAKVIGKVTEKNKGMVTLRTTALSDRVVLPPTGELIPRIC
jgi:hydrogenase expression/formation protein HypE